MNRPLGITLLAVLNFASAAVQIAAGVLVFTGRVSNAITVGTGLDWFLHGPLAGLAVLLLALIQLLIGIGLWRLRNWARRLLVVILGLNCAGLVVALFAAGRLHDSVALIAVALRLAISALLLWYLLSPPVARAFAYPQAAED
ncbi:MAG TPA: hypothetical protein VFA60_09980 [Terriglobales bacterium]|nr:hypothetical protein [Terriglobales bacterium]